MARRARGVSLFIKVPFPGCVECSTGTGTAVPDCTGFPCCFACRLRGLVTPSFPEFRIACPSREYRYMHAPVPSIIQLVMIQYELENRTSPPRARASGGANGSMLDDIAGAPSARNAPPVPLGAPHHFCYSASLVPVLLHVRMSSRLRSTECNRRACSVCERRLQGGHPLDRFRGGIARQPASCPCRVPQRPRDLIASLYTSSNTTPPVREPVLAAVRRQQLSA